MSEDVITVQGPSVPLQLSSCTVDLAAREVVPDDGGPRLLRAREAELLGYLVARPGRDLSRQELLRAVWGTHSQTSRALDVCVRRLRTIIERDPASPDHLHTVRGVGYRLDLPERGCVAPGSRASHLPVRLDRFVGRESELEALAADDDARLRVLVGPPGAGKSRIALMHAHRVLGERPGEVWWCDLADAATRGDVVTKVASCLHSETREPDQLDGLLTGAGRALVVLDNLDAAAGPAAVLVARWLQRAPRLQIVGTSRRALGLPGEVTHPIAPLPPDQAAALFTDRAGPRAGLDVDDPRVVDVVSRVQGVPLALELAASRLRGLSLDELRTRLEASLVDLQSPWHRAERHSSLRRALDTSWMLLNPTEQLALAMLSVFPGGFTAADAGDVLRGALQDALPVLVDHHLVARIDDGARFELLTMVRQFAAERVQVEVANATGPAPAH